MPDGPARDYALLRLDHLDQRDTFTAKANIHTAQINALEARMNGLQSQLNARKGRRS